MVRQLGKSKVNEKGASGVVYAGAAFLLWGALPLYWKVLKSVPALEILMHRIVWSFVFTASLLTLQGQWKQVRGILAQPRKVAAIILSSVLVSLNWGIYIWAVNADHVVDTSLGYYINPLFSVSLGMLVLRERLNFWQLLALILALAGVVTITVQYGKIPWIALSLAISFGLYGLVKKMTNIDSVPGLALETLVLLPLALGVLIYLELQGNGSFGHISVPTSLLLAGGGVVTAVPLIWFARATQKLPLSMVGFIQYLTPTMMLLIGVFVYNEPFTALHLVGFALIWAALALFSLSQLSCFQRWQGRKGLGNMEGGFPSRNGPDNASDP